MDLNTSIRAKSIKISTLPYFLWGVLVFLMFSVPVNLQWLKIIIIAFLLCLRKYNSRVLKVNRNLVNFAIIWFIYAIASFVLGLINNNAGAWAFFKVNVLYYGLLLVVISYMKNPKYFHAAVKAIYYSNIFISLYTLSLLAYSMGYWIGDNIIILDDTSAVGLHTGYVHITNTNLSMTIFTFPFLLFITNTRIANQFFNKKKLFVVLFVTGISMCLSGRRILWIVLFVSLVIYYWKMIKSLTKKIGLFSGLALLGTVCFIIFQRIYDYSFSISGLVSRFTEAFSAIDSYGNENVRILQMIKLWEGFMEHPFIGSGGGATLGTFYRTAIMPWSYEMSYNKILLDSGIFGFCVYAFALFLILYYVNKTKTEYRLSILISLIVALFANATNPYFSGSFDFLLFIFIPLLYVNCMRNEEN